MHIVLVEDNKILAKSIVRVLKQEGYFVTDFIDGAVALAWLKGNQSVYDLIILDVLLPGMDGFALARSLRETNIFTPILILTSKDAMEDTLEGFNAGADDYVKKPFILDELLVRIRALLRRPAITIKENVQLTPDINIDLSSRKVLRKGKEIHLTTKEFAILVHFLHNPNTVVNQQSLYDHIFDFADIKMSNTIEVHIKNLRKKLKTKDYEIPLTTIRGAGYRLDI